MSELDFASELLSLFDDADDVHDTIWYDPNVSLYDCIVCLHERVIKDSVDSEFVEPEVGDTDE